MMRFVDLSGLHLAAAQKIIPPQWARLLAQTAAGDPLIMAGETGGRRVVVVAFDLHKSDLPLQIAFPILMSNLVGWLQPTTSLDTPPQLAPGEPIGIRPQPEAVEVRVTLPTEGGSRGRVTTLQPSAQMSFADTGVPGIYTVQQFAAGKALGEGEPFAVNVPREESNIAPHPDTAFRGTQASAPTEGAVRPWEIWPWVLAASLLLLAVEWWYYNRGGGRRRSRA